MKAPPNSSGIETAQPLPRKKNLPVLSSESFAVKAPEPTPEPQPEPTPQPPQVDPQPPKPAPPVPAWEEAQDALSSEEEEFCYLEEEDASIPLITEEAAVEMDAQSTRMDLDLELTKPLKMEVRAVDFGPCTRKVFLSKNPGAYWDVNLALPDGRVFVIEFRGGPAPIPQMVADFLAREYPRTHFVVE